jgi:UDP-N-acetylmuramoylalanine--D-glutamate ligase
MTTISESLSLSTASRELAGARILVMGLGLHGGGLATAEYCRRHGAHVTVTDVKPAERLQKTLRDIHPEIALVLGEHRESDFRRADIVVKNPAVPRSSPFLKPAGRIETDISLFLHELRGPLYAITGTKGKSTTVSALHQMIAAERPLARLGGNITISPLTFVDELDPDAPVVLELSSFQLGDLMLTPLRGTGVIPQLAVAGITCIYPDHQDYYGSMDAYVADKRLIYQLQPPDGITVIGSEDPYSAAFSPATRVVRVPERPELDALVGSKPALAGEHHRRNLRVAAACAQAAGISPASILRVAGVFPGIPHRMEPIGTIDGRQCINDSAATIPEATLAAVTSFAEPVHLIAGGSDKHLSMEVFAQIARQAASLHLLAGTATDGILAVLSAEQVPYQGPYDGLPQALSSALSRSTPGDVIVLSPGCASFGMFANEFDRGDQFRALVQSTADA